MIDISDKNIFILKKILCGNKYNLNIHKGSFFKQIEITNKDGKKVKKDYYDTSGEWTRHFKTSKFDCIV